jgi:hypothetical protein
MDYKAGHCLLGKCRKLGCFGLQNPDMRDTRFVHHFLCVNAGFIVAQHTHSFVCMYVYIYIYIYGCPEILLYSLIANSSFENGVLKCLKCLHKHISTYERKQYIPT